MCTTHQDYTDVPDSVSLFNFPFILATGNLAMEEVEYLVEAKQSSDPGNMGPLFEWLPQQIWPRVKAIEGLKKYTGRQTTAATAIFI